MNPIACKISSMKSLKIEICEYHYCVGKGKIATLSNRDALLDGSRSGQESNLWEKGLTLDIFNFVTRDIYALCNTFNTQWLA